MRNTSCGTVLVFQFNINGTEYSECFAIDSSSSVCETIGSGSKIVKIR